MKTTTHQRADELRDVIINVQEVLISETCQLDNIIIKEHGARPMGTFCPTDQLSANAKARILNIIRVDLEDKLHALQLQYENL